ncbi:thioester-containing protein I [Anopheles sinensis]|uniref:TEP1-F n=1 Tax=Anopheles sinensis TaxID=74873 RepID=A0A084W9W5_ANOSI|nr:thioester-containing protein I [Anopheles sinensis]
MVGVSQGMLIIGPSKFRSDQKYTLVATNFHNKKLDLRVTLEGKNEASETILSSTKAVDLRKYTNRLIEFQIPANLPRGNYKITIEGQRGFSYYQEIPINFEWKSITGLVQLNKPVFKPGDTVHFRVIVLDSALKPPARITTVNVTITDPLGSVIRRWSAGRLHTGVFENKLDISTSPSLGVWNITVRADGEDILESKTFEVKEYVLSTFDVKVYPKTIPLEEHQGLDLTVTANYHFGKPVKGTALLEIFLDDDELDQSRRWTMYGMDNVKLNFNNLLEVDVDQRNVRVRLTFIEQFTNRTVVKDEEIIIYKNKYRVELVPDISQFIPGKPFKFNVYIKYNDGKPAKNVVARIAVDGLDNKFDETATSDKNGIIKKTVNPSQATESLDIVVSVDDIDLFEGVIDKSESTNYVKVELKPQQSIKPNKLFKLDVQCSERINFLVYYVMSQGKIIDAGSTNPNKLTKITLTINATNNMIPRSKIIVATLVKQTVIYDTVDINIDELLNIFKLRVQDKEAKPGSQLNLHMEGRPGSYVGLAAYDRSLLQHNTNHDVLWKDILDIFNRFHAISQNEFDPFASMGLFARITDNIKIEGVSDTGRWSTPPDASPKKFIPYRTNFLESWLWKNFTMAASGKLEKAQIVPDTTTCWYLTGFSIDPVYGLGIIKKPIELTTVQPFFIVENLPYSIKRGEAALLQFTLFSNLDETHTATVVMLNVANQTEFIGRPAGDFSYTKTIKVSPSEGASVSFLVKARKLGEMVVRLEATIESGEADAIEKVIRVMPESVVETDMQSRMISHNKHENQTFPLTLNIDKLAVDGSQRITFSLYPNLLVPVSQNLENLLAVPTGTGESNMVHFVPNIVVLDYLIASGSKDTALITKVTNLLRQGYQNQMKYRQTDGSFGVWQHDGGSIFITAFVANALQEASKYIAEVDVGMVAKAFDWLAKKQESSGKFVEVGPIIHQDLQGGTRNGIALTSYVLIAFIENESARATHGSVITKGIRYVEQQLQQVNDPYDLSLAIYALTLYEKVPRGDLFNQLIAMSDVFENGAQRYWKRDSHMIETTAYALLAMIQAEKYADGIPIMRWLVNQRYVTGSFPRTQDTFAGLKALAKLAWKISPLRNDYTLQLRNTKTNYQLFFYISPEKNEPHVVDIPSSTRSLEINVAGLGFGVFDVKYEYAVDLKNFKKRFDLTVEKLNKNFNQELKLRICASFVPKLTTERSDLALVEVTFPSGYVVDNDPITDATKVNPIKKTEIRFGATSVVAYYNNMGMEKNCFTITAYRRFNVALKRPAHVKVHDFFKEALYALNVYTVDDQDVCDICDEEDCPKSCKK